MSSTAKFAPTLGGRFWRLQSQVAKPFSSMSQSQSMGTGSLSSTKNSSLGNSSFGGSQNSFSSNSPGGQQNSSFSSKSSSNK